MKYTGVLINSNGKKVRRDFENVFDAFFSFTDVATGLKDSGLIELLGVSNAPDLKGVPDFKIVDETGKLIAEFKKY